MTNTEHSPISYTKLKFLNRTYCIKQLYPLYTLRSDMNDSMDYWYTSVIRDVISSKFIAWYVKDKYELLQWLCDDARTIADDLSDLKLGAMYKLRLLNQPEDSINIDPVKFCSSNVPILAEYAKTLI